MIQKMPTDKDTCKICRRTAQAIIHLEWLIDSIARQSANADDPDPILLKKFRDGLAKLSDWYALHLEGMRQAQRIILGVEYGSKQMQEVSKEHAENYIKNSLQLRGIMDVKGEDIEPRDGAEYVRLSWTEKVAYVPYIEKKIGDRILLP